MTDVVLPDENAFDVLPRIKKLRPSLPVIVMSAKNTIMTAITAAERGAYDYLPKPFDLNALVSLVGAPPSRWKCGPAPAANAAAENLPIIGRSPVDAGNLPDHRAADADRSDRDDRRRVRHRQGTGRACHP